MTSATSKADLCNNLSLRKESRYLGATYGKAIAPLGLRGTQPGTSPQNTAGHDEPGLTATDQ